jgi:hypothetical protein
MTKLCLLACFLIVANVMPGFSQSVYHDVFNITYNIESVDVSVYLDRAKAVQTAVFHLLENVTLTSEHFNGTIINGNSTQQLNKTLNEIIDLAAQVDKLNTTYQNVLTEINMTNAQINSVIDTLHCFENLTTCRVSSLKSTFVKTIMRYFLATTRSVLRRAVQEWRDMRSG